MISVFRWPCNFVCHIHKHCECIMKHLSIFLLYITWELPSYNLYTLHSYLQQWAHCLAFGCGVPSLPGTHPQYPLSCNTQWHWWMNWILHTGSLYHWVQCRKGRYKIAIVLFGCSSILVLPYRRLFCNFWGWKLSRIGEKYNFRGEFADCRAYGCYAPKFHGENFRE